MGAEKVRVRCILDVVNYGTGTFYTAFSKGKEYDVYIEDEGDTIWAYNNKDTDQMLRDFETPNSFFIKHFEIINKNS